MCVCVGGGGGGGYAKDDFDAYFVNIWTLVTQGCSRNVRVPPWDGSIFFLLWAAPYCEN